MMIPSMGVEIFSQKNRSTWPCSKFQQLSRHLSFSVYLSFARNFEDAQIFHSEMKLYIVVHIIYLCEKPVSVDFPRKNTKFFDINTSFQNKTSAYFRYFSFLQADGFLRN